MFKILGFRRPTAAKTLAGSSGGGQSGRINSSHSIIEELACFACSDWMGSSGGDQQPIQKFSQNVTDAGSSTAYSEIQSKRH